MLRVNCSYHSFCTRSLTWGSNTVSVLVSAAEWRTLGGGYGEALLPALILQRLMSSLLVVSMILRVVSGGSPLWMMGSGEYTRAQLVPAGEGCTGAQ